jgi:hypothetical protein
MGSLSSSRAGERRERDGGSDEWAEERERRGASVTEEAAERERPQLERASRKEEPFLTSDEPFLTAAPLLPRLRLRLRLALRLALR